MHLIPSSLIQIKENRQRREFDDQLLMELADSIRSNGLLHPVVVRDLGDSVYLVAGERRLRAIGILHDLGETYRHNNTIIDVGHVPVVSLGELSTVAAEEAELEENLRRVNLSWQEQADAILRLKTLRDSQAKLAGAPVPSLADLAAEVIEPKREGFEGLVTGQSAAAQQLSRTLLVARNLHDKDVAGAKTLADAVKIVRRKENDRKNLDLAAVVGKTFSSADHSLINEDYRVWAEQQPGEQFDVILTDPPYGMGAQDFGDAGGKLVTQTHEYDDSYASWQLLMSIFCPTSYVLAKPSAHLYVFCDIERFVELRDGLKAAGWRMFRTPLVIYKKDGNRLPWPEHGPQRKYELCAFGIKGDRRVNSVRPDVVECVGDENLGHGAQKPVALYSELLRRSIRPGDAVADFFGGTGPLLPAAHELKCKATVIEKDPSAYAIALQRLQKLK